MTHVRSRQDRRSCVVLTVPRGLAQRPRHVDDVPHTIDALSDPPSLRDAVSDDGGADSHRGAVHDNAHGDGVDAQRADDFMDMHDVFMLDTDKRVVDIAIDGRATRL